jgi:hypothetical protein
MTLQNTKGNKFYFSVFLLFATLPEFLDPATEVAKGK